MKPDGSDKSKKNVYYTVVLFFCFQIFLYSPLEVYFNNLNDFWYDYRLIIPVMICVFLIFLISLIIIFRMIFKVFPEKINMVAITVFFAISLCMYVEGNFFSGFLPELNGNKVDWGSYGFERIRSLVLWVVVIGTVIFFTIKYNQKILKVIKYISLFITAIQFVTIISFGLMNKGFVPKTNYCAMDDRLWDYSTQKNVIVLVLDDTDETVFAEALDAHPEYYDWFSDFTYYNNAISTYNATNPSVPLILSGVMWHETSEPYKEYCSESIRRSKWINSMIDHGYNVRIYDTDFPFDDDCENRFDNVMKIEYGVTDIWAFVRWNMQMTCYKYFPFEAKRICIVNPSALNDLKKPASGKDFFSSDNYVFYDDINTKKINKTDTKECKFIHLDGAHSPYDHDGNMNKIENGTYLDGVECAAFLAHSYLEKLKSEGLYEYTAIIIMADHGELDIRHRPIFMAKGFGCEKRKMKISSIPLQYSDIWEYFSNLFILEKDTDESTSYLGDECKPRYYYAGGGEGKAVRFTEYVEEVAGNPERKMLETGKITEFDQW